MWARCVHLPGVGLLILCWLSITVWGIEKRTSFTLNSTYNMQKGAGPLYIILNQRMVPQSVKGREKENERESRVYLCGTGGRWEEEVSI